MGWSVAGVVLDLLKLEVLKQEVSELQDVVKVVEQNLASTSRLFSNTKKVKRKAQSELMAVRPHLATSPLRMRSIWSSF